MEGYLKELRFAAIGLTGAMLLALFMAPFYVWPQLICGAMLGFGMGVTVATTGALAIWRRKQAALNRLHMLIGRHV